MKLKILLIACYLLLMVKLMLFVMVKADFHPVTVFFLNEVRDFDCGIDRSVLAARTSEIDLKVFKPSFQIVINIDRNQAFYKL